MQKSNYLERINAKNMFYQEHERQIRELRNKLRNNELITEMHVLNFEEAMECHPSNFALPGLRIGTVGLLSKKDRRLSASLYAMCALQKIENGGAIFFTPECDEQAIRYMQKSISHQIEKKIYDNICHNVKIVSNCNFWYDDYKDTIKSMIADFNNLRLLIINECSDFKYRHPCTMGLFDININDESYIKSVIRELSEIAKTENIAILCVVSGEFVNKFSNLDEIKYDMKLSKEFDPHGHEILVCNYVKWSGVLPNNIERNRYLPVNLDQYEQFEIITAEEISSKLNNILLDQKKAD